MKKSQDCQLQFTFTTLTKQEPCCCNKTARCNAVCFSCAKWLFHCYLFQVPKDSDSD